MKNSGISRLAAGSAIAYGVMGIVGNNLSRTMNSAHTPQQVATYFATHAPSTATWVGIYIESLGAIAFLLFGICLWSIGRDRDPSGLTSMLVLGAAILQAAMILSGEPSKIALYYRAAHGIDPQLAAALLDLNNASFYLSFMPQALLAAAASGLALRTLIFPAWLALAGLAVSLALLIAIGIPPGYNAHMLIIGVFLLWMMATGIVLLWRSGLRNRALSTGPDAV